MGYVIIGSTQAFTKCISILVLSLQNLLIVVIAANAVRLVCFMCGCIPWVLMFIPNILPSFEYGMLAPLIVIECVFLIAKGITVNLLVLVLIFHFFSKSFIFVISRSTFLLAFFLIYLVA